MTKMIRYFILLMATWLPLTSFAVDHITCSLTRADIPAAAQVGVPYTNVYTCINTYPASFPSIQLAGTVFGFSNGVSVDGSCTTEPIAFGDSCQFNLNATLQTTNKQNTNAAFYLQISIGSLYYINLPTVTTIISSNPATGIDWPGYNVGYAEVDSSGDGTGVYTADAVDASGHTVTYIFSLSGAGTVTGDQTGNLTLSGINVNNPGTVRVTATADDADSVPGVPIPITTNNNIPFKVVSIYNNTTEVIYPIIEAPILDVDNWLQAQFAISAANINTYLFTDNRLHRVYTNPAGLQPGASVTVEVPFYSELVATPSGGNVADQYVDWWNAMRVYLYDVQANFQIVYNTDLANADTLHTPGLKCLTGCTGTLPSYNSGVPPTVNAVPANDPVQLTEYTFADVVTGNGAPFPIDSTHVDYDYSAVDQVYLPIAMGTYNNPQIGYTGTITPLNTFRSALTTFVNTAPTWPTYVGTPPYTNPRVPGAYNVVIGNQSLTPNAVTLTNDLLAYWADCTSGTSINPEAPNCLDVQDLFTKNYANYQTLCSDSSPVTPINMLQHIYGWVAFTCPSQLNNALAQTPGANYALAQSSYLTLQYSGVEPPTNTAFNGYVSLVHTDLSMNVYAFSIDDAVGNMNEVGDGIVITIGGSEGLPNPNQYDPNLIVNVNPGTPPVGSPNPVFTAFGICSATADSGTLARGAPFKIQAVNYPCQITLQDSNNLLYTFTLLSSPPFVSGNTYISCASGDTWCAGVNIDFTTQHDVATPPPTV